MNTAAKVLHHLRHGRRAGWHPLLAVYYLTYRCDFRCPYCSDGAQEPYWSNRARAPGADVALEILARIRRHCEHLVVTGGEPLLHPAVAEVMEGVAALRFADVIFTTNGYSLDEHLDRLAPTVDHLVISLDTLDASRSDAWTGRGEGTHARILANLEAAACHPHRRGAIVISSVVTPENIEDLYAVFELCRARGFVFAACPQLVGVEPHPALRDNEAYRRFFDFLIAHKKRGARIQGSPLFLERMRDLPLFRCRPLTMLSVAPGGEVFYPCLEKGDFAGNLLAEPDLGRLHRAAVEKLGPLPACGNQCHSACALGFATALDHPASALQEGWLWLTGPLRRLAIPGSSRFGPARLY
jgi:MoaA/NifB/PqqE/SkfB family radical SAM enzyme